MRNLLSLFLSIILASPVLAQADFSDRSAEAGLPATLRNKGIAVGDFDNDGWEDLFIARSRLNHFNSLLHNNGDGTFTDVSDLLGDYSQYSRLGLWFDFDNDGDLDLFIGNDSFEPNRLYRNEGGRGFTDVSETAGISGFPSVRSANAGDLNGDGWLDLYLNNFREENNLFINNGPAADGSGITFTETIAASGASDRQSAMGVVLFDCDDDGDLDIYLTLDGQPNILFENDGNAHFTDISKAAGVAHDGDAMGVDVADINLDGRLDIYIANLYENTLLLAQPDGSYRDIAAPAGVDDYGMGWGINFLDYNNDSYPDIYVVNEYTYAPDVNLLYENQGDSTFAIANTPVLDSPFAGYGSATADLNDDGRVDLLIANFNAGVQYLQNNSPAGHWVKLKLIDRSENVFAIGAKVRIYLKDKTLYDQITAGSSYSSQSSSTVHFGLGTETEIMQVGITWPDGREENYYNLPADRHFLVVKNEGIQLFDHEKYRALLDQKVTTATETPAETGIVVYPVPARDKLWLIPANMSTENLIISLSDLGGRRLWQKELSLPEPLIQVDLPAVPAGMYILALDQDDGKRIATRQVILR